MCIRDRLRTLTFGLLTPFYFIRAGSLVSLPALVAAPFGFIAPVSYTHLGFARSRGNGINTRLDRASPLASSIETFSYSLKILRLGEPRSRFCSHDLASCVPYDSLKEYASRRRHTSSNRRFRG